LAYLIAFILILVVAGAVLLFTPLGERPFRALFPEGEIKAVDFASLQLAETPNQYLVCPPDFCAAAPNAFSPVFDMPADQLRARWKQVVADQPRVRQFATYEDGMQIDYVQRSARFRFPDVVTVRFIPLPSSQSTLAVYSRSVYGRDDLGVNRKRIETWLELLRRGQ
jgi:uncharacterized protein (DUF1499 family)